MSAAKQYVYENNMCISSFNAQERQFELTVRHKGKWKKIDISTLKYAPLLNSIMTSTTPFVTTENYIMIYARSRIWIYQYKKYVCPLPDSVPIEPILTVHNTIPDRFHHKFTLGEYKFKFDTLDPYIIQSDRALFYNMHIQLKVLFYIQLPAGYEFAMVSNHGNHARLLIRVPTTRHERRGRMYYAAVFSHKPAKWYEYPSDDYRFAHRSDELITLDRRTILVGGQYDIPVDFNPEIIFF